MMKDIGIFYYDIFDVPIVPQVEFNWMSVLTAKGSKKYKGYLNRDAWYFPPDYLEKLKTSLLQRKK